MVVSCYSPGDHWLGLPLHTDAHGNILAFSYGLVHKGDLQGTPKCQGPASAPAGWGIWDRGLFHPSLT